MSKSQTSENIIILQALLLGFSPIAGIIVIAVTYQTWSQWPAWILYPLVCIVGIGIFFLGIWVQREERENKRLMRKEGYYDLGGGWTAYVPPEVRECLEEKEVTLEAHELGF